MGRHNIFILVTLNPSITLQPLLLVDIHSGYAQYKFHRSTSFSCHRIDGDHVVFDQFLYMPLETSFFVLQLSGNIYEIIIHCRLCWLLAFQIFLSSNQYGFCADTFTQDQLFNIHGNTKKSFCQHAHLLAIFFDCEKAFNRVYRYQIIQQFFDQNIKCRLPLVIQDFLHMSTFSVWISNTTSSTRILNNVVPLKELS